MLDNHLHGINLHIITTTFAFPHNSFSFAFPRDDIMERRALVELNSKEYEHPFDQKALKALEGTPGLETLVKNFTNTG